MGPSGEILTFDLGMLGVTADEEFIHLSDTCLFMEDYLMERV